MAATKSSTKASPVKRPAPATGSIRVKPAAAKAEPVTKAVPAKTAPRTTPKAAAGTAVKPVRARKVAGVPAEQRRHYIEMAAYYIAERRGFAPGNPLQDWVQAEAEIDRLLAGGLLGA